VGEFLEKRRFGELKAHLVLLRVNHAEDTMTYEEATHNVKNFAGTLLKEKKHRLRDFQKMGIE
jgi:hypothetical protein